MPEIDHRCERCGARLNCEESACEVCGAASHEIGSSSIGRSQVLRISTLHDAEPVSETSDARAISRPSELADSQ